MPHYVSLPLGVKRIVFATLIMGQVQLATLSRSHIPEKDRVPFYLYADEFYNFTTLAFVDALSEARKYGLCLTLAHVSRAA